MWRVEPWFEYEAFRKWMVIWTVCALHASTNRTDSTKPYMRTKAKDQNIIKAHQGLNVFSIKDSMCSMRITSHEQHGHKLCKTNVNTISSTAICECLEYRDNIEYVVALRLEREPLASDTPVWLLCGSHDKGSKTASALEKLADLECSQGPEQISFRSLACRKSVLG